MTSVCNSVIDEERGHVLIASALSEREVFAHGSARISIAFHTVPNFAAIGAVMTDNTLTSGVVTMILCC